jgi:hypothetical protein
LKEQTVAISTQDRRPEKNQIPALNPKSNPPCGIDEYLYFNFTSDYDSILWGVPRIHQHTASGRSESNINSDMGKTPHSIRSMILIIIAL